MNEPGTLIPVTWRQVARANGSIEIRHGARLVAIVSKDHPDMVSNAITISHAPAFLAAIWTFADACDTGKKVALVPAHARLLDVFEAFVADERNARAPRRMRR